MTATHDKEWIVESKTDLITIFKTGDKVEGFGYIPIENTLLDQIRRDAVDEYMKQYKNMSGDMIAFNLAVTKAKKEACSELLDDYYTLIKPIQEELQTGFGSVESINKLNSMIVNMSVKLRAKTLWEQENGK